MLRKLFIGLLILSALTSRGAGGEIYYISDLQERLSPESLLNLCSDRRLAAADLPDACGFALCGSVPGGVAGAFVPLEEFIRVKSLGQHIFSSIGDNIDYGCREICLRCARPASHPYSEKSAPTGTDVSPPAL